MQHSIDHDRMTKLSATIRPMPAQLDHIVIGADHLESGTRWTEARLQSAMDGGGAHPLMSTHNRLMRLAGGPYLEVIAIDPAAPSPDRPRWFTLDDTQQRSGGWQTGRLPYAGWPRYRISKNQRQAAAMIVGALSRLHAVHCAGA